MTALTLREIAVDALADIGMDIQKRRRLGAARETIWARQLPGFGVRRYESGREMYVVQTMMGGKLRTVTLCNVRLVSRGKALEIARQIILRAKAGENPAEARKQVRQTPSFETFLELYWTRMAPKWKPATLATHNTYRQNCIDGAFGRRSIDKIAQSDVAEWFSRIAQRRGPGCANRALDILRAIFAKAEDWGVRPASSNPANGIRRYPQQRYARFLREEEIVRLGTALKQEVEAFPVHVAAIRLLLLTGCRSSEITGLLWSEVVGRRLKLVDSKTGPRTVWLGAEARALLSNIIPTDRSHVFCASGRDRPICLTQFWGAFRKRHGFEGLRIHDLRHSYASLGAAMSETLPMIGELLGHRSIKSTARYAHLDDRDLQAAAEKIGNVIASLAGEPCSLQERGRVA